jgi:GNAT superfamily N-acetyltransferase
MTTTPTTDVATDVEVRVLTSADEAAATPLLARGFDEEPGALALLPDPRIRRAMLEANARVELQATLPLGTVHGAFVGDAIAAIAMWHAPGVRRTSLTTTLRKLAATSRHPGAVARVAPHAMSVMVGNASAALSMQRARARAVERAGAGSAWHLAVLATAPEHRGRGLARRLLERQLARCDADALPAWLETTDPVNPPIYERFGFETVLHVDDAAWLPGLWVMRRPPKGTVHAGAG